MITQRQLEVKYELLNSVEEMLSPDRMSEILQRKVSHVTCQPFESAGGLSGSLLYRVYADDYPLILKRLRLSLDWISVTSEDRRCRSVRLWQYGLLDRLRPHLEHAQLAACQEGDEYAILMHDVSRGLFQWGQEVAVSTIYRLLDSLAAMHAMFWEDESLQDPDLGLCNNVESLIKGSWPIHTERYRHDPKTVDMITRGWEALFDMLEPDVRDSVQALMDNLRPVLDALARYPSTFIHADYRLGNLALLPDTDQVVAFDWQVASYAPAILCMSWFVMTGDVFPIQDAAVEYYRAQLAARLGDRIDPDAWQPMYDVGCLVDVLRKGNWHAFFAAYSDTEEGRVYMRRSVDSYIAVVRNGLKWL